MDPKLDLDLDAIPEIDEDPPPELASGAIVDIDTLPQTAGALGRVAVDESIVDIGAVYPAPERGPIGGVKPSSTSQQLGFVEPWVRLSGSEASPPESTPKAVPTPEQIEDLKAYFVEQRAALLREVESIEAQLGFIANALDLAVRVARIEAFLGIHP